MSPQLGPNILPITEQIRFMSYYSYDYVTRHFLHPCFPRYFPPRQKMYRPDFKKSIDHFCIHAGGRAVIEGVQKNLQLTEKDVAPSFFALKNWGNTSRRVVVSGRLFEAAVRLRELGTAVWRICGHIRNFVWMGGVAPSHSRHPEVAPLAQGSHSPAPGPGAALLTRLTLPQL